MLLPRIPHDFCNIPDYENINESCTWILDLTTVLINDIILMLIRKW
jgi:hypothetical protein